MDTKKAKIVGILIAMLCLAWLAVGCDPYANPDYDPSIGCVENYYDTSKSCPEGYVTYNWSDGSRSCILACETDDDCSDCPSRFSQICTGGECKDY